MKIIFLNVFLLLAADTVFAVDYICRGGAEEPIVEIVELNDRPQFRYLVDGKTRLSLTMNEGSVQPVTQLPIGFEAGQTFIFRPEHNMRSAHIYGRILPRGAVFDIFTTELQQTLVDYECRVKAQ